MDRISTNDLHKISWSKTDIPRATLLAKNIPQVSTLVSFYTKVNILLECTTTGLKEHKTSTDPVLSNKRTFLLRLSPFFNLWDNCLVNAATEIKPTQFKGFRSSFEKYNIKFSIIIMMGTI